MHCRFGLCLLLLLSIDFALAETIEVSGDVGGIWSADTVLVMGECTIPSYATLMIDPGVRVLFFIYSALTVSEDATLMALGTAQDSIYFDEYWPGLGWRGIRFREASDDCVLEYCHLAHGDAHGSGEDANGGAVNACGTDLTIVNCTFEYCIAEDYGGGLYFGWPSQSVLVNSVVRHCTAGFSGGGITISSVSDITMLGCLVESNRATFGIGGISGGENNLIHRCIVKNNESEGNNGGISIRYGTSPFTGNIICDNYAEERNGGMIVHDSELLIEGNIFYGNRSTWASAGLTVEWYSDECVLRNNSFVNNEAIFGGSNYTEGGGLTINGSDVEVEHNLFYDNFAAYGAGAYLDGSNASLKNNTFCGNSATNYGSAIYCTDCPNVDATSCIVWGNYPTSIYLYDTNFIVTYSDIMSGWAGTGNLESYPFFVYPERGNFHLLPQSPCIDAGNPDPLHLDPDGTVSDMGAFYFDQTLPVHIHLTQHQILPIFGPDGGSLDYTLTLVNTTETAQDLTFWCEVLLPDSSCRTPLFGPYGITLEACEIAQVDRTQNVPDWAPWGIYDYQAKAIVGSDTVSSQFRFIKTLDDAGGYSADWKNTGGLISSARLPRRTTLTNHHILVDNYPNPFNSKTTITYFLADDGRVKLSIYNISGRLVSIPVDGFRTEGWHELTFDAKDLPSGVYMYLIHSGDITKSGKMLYLK